MTKKVLVVVDMQKDFVDEDGALSVYPALEADSTNNLIENIAANITNFTGKIVCTLDTHDKCSPEFNQFPPHCIQGEEGWFLTSKIASAVAAREKADMRRISMLKKDSFSNQDTAKFLAVMHKDAEYHFAGVCTHICVHDIIASLYHEYKNRYGELPKIVVNKELVGDFDSKMEQGAFDRMERLYNVEVI